MFSITNRQDSKVGFRCLSVLWSTPFMLFLLAGCNPCMPINICDDGNACNGVETCVENDLGLADCGSGIPITCDEGSTCVDPAGMCVADDLCADVMCDTSDMCNPEVCVDGECVLTPVVCNTINLCIPQACVEGSCVDMPVVCPEGEVCEPTSGDCVDSTTVTPIISMISQAIGAYSGASMCGDDDDQVTFTLEQNTLSMLGFTGNVTIDLTVIDDLTATGENVTAFGVPGHDLTLTLDPVMGYISTTLTLPDGTSCNTDLMLLPC